MFYFIYAISDHSRISRIQYLSSSLFLNDERFVGLRWNSSAGVLHYTLSCPNKECKNETLNENENDALVRVFTMDEVIVTLTAMYPCNITTTVQGIVPQVGTPTSRAGSPGI